MDEVSHNGTFILKISDETKNTHIDIIGGGQLVKRLPERC